MKYDDYFCNQCLSLEMSRHHEDERDCKQWYTHITEHGTGCLRKEREHATSWIRIQTTNNGTKK